MGVVAVSHQAYGEHDESGVVIESLLECGLLALGRNTQDTTSVEAAPCTQFNVPDAEDVFVGTLGASALDLGEVAGVEGQGAFLPVLLGEADVHQGATSGVDDGFDGFSVGHGWTVWGRPPPLSLSCFS